MAARGAVQDRFLRQGGGGGEAEGRDQGGLAGRIPGSTVEDLDDPAEHDEAGIAVGVRRTRFEELLDVLEQRDIPLHALVATAGVGDRSPSIPLVWVSS